MERTMINGSMLPRNFIMTLMTMEKIHFSLMVLAILGFMMLSFGLHELGHYLYWAKSINKNVRFDKHFSVVGRFRPGEVSNSKLFQFYFVGVGLGLIPLIFFFANSTYFGALMIIVYMLACRHDLRQMWGIVRDHKKKR